MPKQRMATDVFKDGGLGPTGQAVYDHIKSKSGKDSNVILLQPGDDKYNTGGGYVPFDKREDVYVDPGKGGAHVLGHELGHSQFRTDLADKFVQNIMKYRKPYSPSDVQINELDPTKGSTIRYVYEKETVPTMLEEANAQGVAVGTTEAIGLGNQEDKTMFATPTEYPESFGKRGIDRLNSQFSPVFEGKPLGIGISGLPEQREEYYRIQDNMPQRVERAYQRGKSLVQ